jgi:tetratricopeptide (TPR) repeat protein
MYGPGQELLRQGGHSDAQTGGPVHLQLSHRGLRQVARPAAFVRLTLLLALTVALAAGASGCFGVIALRPELRTAAAIHDAEALADGVEKLIDEQRDREQDREAAFDAVRQWPQKSAAYAFARARLAGRLAQVKVLTAVGLVAEAEKWARRSNALDPAYRDGAARRMLGTLYVVAPAALVKHGDSEEGLELLEALLDEHPDNPENQLRLAEAYVSLDDPEPAYELLCSCLAAKDKLRPDSQRVLARLVDAVDRNELGCPAEK